MLAPASTTTTHLLAYHRVAGSNWWATLTPLTTGSIVTLSATAMPEHKTQLTYRQRQRVRPSPSHASNAWKLMIAGYYAVFTNW